MSLNIKILTTKALIISAFLFSFSPAFAQITLKHAWKREPGGLGLKIRGLTITHDDSTILISGDRSDAQGGIVGNFYKINSSSGEIVSFKDSSLSFDYIKILQDGNNMICSSEINGVFGLYDYHTLEKKFSISFPIAMRGFQFSEKNMKALACGKNLIRLYDLNTQELIKEFNFQYSDNECIVLQAQLSNDGNSIVYYCIKDKIVNGYKNSFTQIKIIDLNGSLIKDFGEVGYTGYKKICFSSDGKTLLYYADESLVLYDLDNKKYKAIINIGKKNIIEALEISSDGKFALVGSGGPTLIYCDIDARKSTIFNNESSWENFKIGSKNLSIYAAYAFILSKYEIENLSDVNAATEQSNFSLETNQNEILVKSQIEISPNWRFSISGTDGKEIKQFNLNDISLTTTSAILNISELATGTYFLRIEDSQNTLAVLKFLKVN